MSLPQLLLFGLFEYLPPSLLREAGYHLFLEDLVLSSLDANRVIVLLLDLYLFILKSESEYNE